MSQKTMGVVRGRNFGGTWYVDRNEYDKAVRKATMRLLGDKCARCGFDDWRALQVDHVNGLLGKIRGSHKYPLYLAIRESIRKGTNEYQLLCANCNWIKRFENNENNYTRQQKISADLSSGNNVHSVNVNLS